MKKSIILSAVAILFVVGLYSCQTDGTTSPLMQGSTTTSQVDMYNATFSLPDYSTTASTLVEGTTDQEIASCPPPPPPPTGGTGVGQDGGMGMNPRDRFDPLGMVLFRLKLTPEQMSTIKTYMKDHLGCVKDAQQALRDSERPIMERARVAQKAIMDQVKAGKMNRADAKIALKALNEATRKALNENPAREIACNAMKDCQNALFDYIYSQLDDTQKPIFKAWRDKLPVVDCTPKTPTRP